ncbi:MAG: glycosyltransferase [Candidatus Thermoplasmatota archaeon]|nr:glycosyltransferase [Candidatus Thermoplasmatota archaeon]
MMISIIITVKNEERDMPDLLDSLVVQEQPIEVIIVDANSEDRTQEIVKEYSERYEFIKLYIHGGTRGKARNFGVEKANGDLVAFIDGDEIVNPFWAEEIRKSAKKYDVVAGKTIQIGYHGFEELERVELFHKGYDITYPSCNLLYDKALFEKIDGFDPWFQTAEDIDLNLRAVEAGATIGHNEDAIVYHRTRGSFFGFFKQAFWNGFGRKQLTMKHGKLWSNYSPGEMLDHQITPWYFARMIPAFLGYLGGKLFGKRPEESDKPL